MDEELQKHEFIIDFLCSELATEVYKNAIRELSVNTDRARYLTSFGEALWKEIERIKSEADDESSEWNR
jgi:hypothetical protein